MKSSPDTFTITDITGSVTFLEYNGIRCQLIRQANGRVVAQIEASNEVYRLLAEFQSNPSLPIGDFLSVQRRLRGAMLDLRDGHNGYGARYGKTVR